MNENEAEAGIRRLGWVRETEEKAGGRMRLRARRHLAKTPWRETWTKVLADLNAAEGEARP